MKDKPSFLTKYLAIPILEEKHYEMKCPYCGVSVVAPINRNLHCECGATYRLLAGTWYHPRVGKL